MKLEWSVQALADLDRLHAFLAPVNPQAAANVVQSLTQAPEHLLIQPRMGARLDRYAPREVRRIFVGDYEMRYEILGDTISIVQIWHGREDR
jgi:plasmid stabilization system protein ParE